MVDKDLFLYDLAVVAILKCEGSYLKEWLDYHLAAGVDHFYLYDNDSSDNQAEVAKPYVEAGLVEYFPFPGHRMQYFAYHDAIRRFKFQSRYMAFIDGDEFIYPKTEQSIVEVADEILSHDEKATSLAINWQNFGSNNQDKADYSCGVLERFTRRAPKNWRSGRGRIADNTFTKIIANPRKIDFFRSPHDAYYFEGCYSIDENAERIEMLGRNFHVPVEKIAVNHYAIKSREEYANRIQRGDALFDVNPRSMEKFDSLDRNEEFDDGILKYRDARLKVYQPPKARSADDLIKALERNLSLALKEATPLEFYEGKVETFLTCRAVASYLKKNLYEETALKAILKSLQTRYTFADAGLLLRELPELLKLPYPAVEELRKL